MMMYCGLVALSKAERRAITMKSMLDDLSCEGETHRSQERIRGAVSGPDWELEALVECWC